MCVGGVAAAASWVVPAAGQLCCTCAQSAVAAGGCGAAALLEAAVALASGSFISQTRRCPPCLSVTSAWLECWLLIVNCCIVASVWSDAKVAELLPAIMGAMAGINMGMTLMLGTCIVACTMGGMARVGACVSPSVTHKCFVYRLLLHAPCMVQGSGPRPAWPWVAAPNLRRRARRR